MKKILLVTEINQRFGEAHGRFVPAYAAGMISRFSIKHDVEVLLVDDSNVAGTIPEFETDSGQKIRLHRVIGREIEPLVEETMFDDRRFIFNSQKVCKFLLEHHYDVVILDVRNGYGFVPTRSKRVGLYFRDTILISWLRTCHEFERELSRKAPEVFDNYVLDRQREFAEQYSCENSDVVFVQAEAILEWSRIKNWNIDENRVIQISDFDASDPLLSFPQMPTLGRTGDTMDDVSNSWPLVSVCVPHFNDGHNLVGLLKSLDKSTYRNFEVLVVDDGSSDAESLSILKQLEETYSSRNWRFIFKQENESIGPTRNFAVSQASGDIIIFMDSDNLATLDMVFDFVRGIETSGMDCLTCAMIIFTGESDNVSEKDILCCRMPVGNCLEAGIYFNEFGDANFCVRKSVFLKLGGFTGSRGEVADDWEFLARLFLSGYKLDVVPKPIFFYRVRQNSWLTSAWSHHSVQALRKKIVSNTGAAHQQKVHDMLIEMIAENERLREIVRDSDRQIVRIAIRLANMMTPQKRVAFQRLTRKLKGIYSNSFLSSAVGKAFELLKHGKSSSTRSESPRDLPREQTAFPEKQTVNSDQDSKTGVYLRDTGKEPAELLRHAPLGSPLFGFVGELRDDNRPLGFLRLAYWMQMFGDDSYFLMVGDGPMARDVKTTCNQYKLTNFGFTPNMDERHKLYGALTGFVMISQANEIPPELIEALSHGIPVFCSGNEKASSLIRDYGSGFCVNHDPEKKDFADCFSLWKKNIAIYRTAALETSKMFAKANQAPVEGNNF